MGFLFLTLMCLIFLFVDVANDTRYGRLSCLLFGLPAISGIMWRIRGFSVLGRAMLVGLMLTNAAAIGYAAWWAWQN
jgi:hypothetical protein